MNKTDIKQKIDKAKNLLLSSNKQLWESTSDIWDISACKSIREIKEHMLNCSKHFDSIKTSLTLTSELLSECLECIEHNHIDGFTDQSSEDIDHFQKTLQKTLQNIEYAENFVSSIGEILKVTDVTVSQLNIEAAIDCMDMNSLYIVDSVDEAAVMSERAKKTMEYGEELFDHL